jgi:serine protease
VLSPTMIVEQWSSIRTNTYRFLPGTSMAAPHVAGIAALMKSVYPGMGSNEFFTAVSSGKITLDLAQNGSTNKDPEFGYGRIDAQKAIDWAWKESQGSSGDAFLTTSIAAANFGSNQLSRDFVISKGGEGAISVADMGDSEAWIQVFTVSTNNEGLGTYRINVDRTGLIDGSYTGWIAIEGSDGSLIWISVAMQVGRKVAGEAGYLYALLLDSWTFGNVKEWSGLAFSDEYLINLDSNPPGRYFLLIGSDIDNDFVVCDSGEFCQMYPLNSQASEIIVSDRDVQLGNFFMGFPDDNNSGNVSSAAFDSSSQNKDPEGKEIMAKIGTSGVSRER